MRHFGLTGNIASGKSAVAEMLAAHGATVIDSDVLARLAVEQGSPGYRAVVKEFGREVLKPDGELNRGALSKIVFDDPAKRAALVRIIHPIVGRLRTERLRQALDRGDAIVVSDIPLLFEVGLEDEFDGIIVVDAAAEVRLSRLVRTRGMKREHALAVMNAQWPAEQKRADATWVIDNNGSRNQLAVRVAELWTRLLECDSSSKADMSRRSRP